MFLLILKILLNFFLGRIYKVLKIFKIFPNKSFKLCLWNIIFVFNVKLVLLSPKVDLSVEKKICKKSLNIIFGNGNIKMINYITNKYGNTLYKTCNSRGPKVKLSKIVFGTFILFGTILKPKGKSFYIF